MSAAPTLLVRLDLEQPPVLGVIASTEEDEQRLRLWLSTPAARRHVLRAVDDALDGLARRRAA